MAYERDTFVGGSSVFSLSLYEVRLWDYYHTYIQRSKIDRMETPMLYAGLGSCANKLKSVKKLKDVMAEPMKPKKSAMSLFSRARFLKPKKKK